MSTRPANRAPRHRADPPDRGTRAGRTGTRRPRTRSRVAVVVAAGLLLGGGGVGSAVALWRDTVTVPARVTAGAVAFAVGRVPAGAAEPVPTGTLAPYLDAATGPGAVLPVTLGPAEAAALTETGAVAVPIRVDALAQGNLGLRYEAHLPTPAAGSILGSARLVLVRVTDPAACTPPGTLPPAGALTSTPVPATYSTTTTPVTEYWCLLARLDEAPVAGSATATGTVVADSEYGSVSDGDTWTAYVQPDPAAEPEVEIRFTHTTFRPGA